VASPGDAQRYDRIPWRRPEHQTPDKPAVVDNFVLKSRNSWTAPASLVNAGEETNNEDEDDDEDFCSATGSDGSPSGEGKSGDSAEECCCRHRLRCRSVPRRSPHRFRNCCADGKLGLYLDYGLQDGHYCLFAHYRTMFQHLLLFSVVQCIYEKIQKHANSRAVLMVEIT
jgi:hypothetical protein